jgi:hypothetical protein
MNNELVFKIRNSLFLIHNSLFRQFSKRILQIGFGLRNL